MHENLWVAFSHGHVGFSMEQITDRIIAELVSDDVSVIDSVPFDLSRFD